MVIKMDMNSLALWPITKSDTQTAKMTRKAIHDFADLGLTMSINRPSNPRKKLVVKLPQTRARVNVPLGLRMGCISSVVSEAPVGRKTAKDSIIKRTREGVTR